MSIIDKQTHPLFTELIISKLKVKNINTIYQFADQDSQLLSKVTSLPFKSILLIKKHILRKNAAVERNAFDYYKEILKNTAIISTNYSELDALLGGGFCTGNIYEICGKSVSYNTRFCYKLIAQFLAKHKNQQKVIFYDTAYCFNAFDLKALSDKQFGPNNQVLENVWVEQTPDIYKLIAALYELKQQFVNKQIKLRIVVIESLSTILHQIASNEKSNMLINCLINIIRLIMIEYQVVFIVMNLLTNKRNGNEVVEKLAGGKYWQTLPNVRLKVAVFGIVDENKNCEITISKSNHGNFDQKCKISL